MAHRLKSLSGIPYDVSTLNGPAILPAHGEITVELSAFEIEVMHHSPDIEISAGEPEDAGTDVARLRKDYADLIGKKPFAGWDAAELQKRIDAHLAS